MKPRRKKRFSLADDGGRWDSRLLTYRILNYPSSLNGKRDDVAKQLKRALDVWSKVAQLDFVAKNEGTANIEISFVKGNHGDDELGSFDGPGGTLAHAFYPIKHKGIHFDDDEQFTIDADGNGIDLFQLAVHEIGHALGIDHSANNETIMYLAYIYRANFKLHSYDMELAQELFGKRRKITLAEPPNLCFDSAFDAITRTEDGTTYVFKGEFYWRLTSDEIGKDAPGRIDASWTGLPGYLDAAATLPDGNTYFFKGNELWIFRNQKLIEGPKFIASVFDGLPDNIDAAFFWAVDKQLYFFKADGYWKYSNGKVAGSGYPRSITTAWRGVPTHLNDVFTWQDNKTYFFKGNQYYRFNVDDDSVSLFPGSI